MMAVTVVETSIGDRDLLVAGSGGTANACAVKCGQVPRQRGSAPASRPGLQSGELHADVGLAEGSGALVSDHATGEAGEDRGQSCPPWPVRHVSIG